MKHFVIAANGDSPENNITHFQQQQPNVLNEGSQISFEMKGFGDSKTSQPTSHVFPTDQADASSCTPKNRIFSDQADLGLARGSLDQQKRKMHLFEKNVPMPKVHESNAKFCNYDLVFGVIAIVIFLFDIVTDVMMVVHYFREKQYEYGGVTAALVVVSSVITCLLGLHWYLIDYHKEKKRTDTEHLALTPKYVWALRILCTLFMFGPVVRIIEYLYCGHKSRNIKCHQEEREKYKQAMLYKDLNSCLLRLFESFLESAPQLAWQIYIAIKLKRASDTISISLLVGTLLSSWMSLAMSLLSYHKSLRNSNDLKAKMSLKSLPFYFIWRLSEVGGRILCIAFFASAFDLWVFGILTLHWITVSVWLIMQNTSFYKKTLQEKLFNLICSFVMIFCFLNMREGHTRYRVIIFYLLVYIENAFMLAFWFRFTKDLGAWFHLWGFIVVLVLFALHVSFQVVYYTLFHPTQNIPLCLPCNRHTIYSSMCDDLTHSRREEPPAENVNAHNTNQPLESCTPMLSASLSL